MDGRRATGRERALGPPPAGTRPSRWHQALVSVHRGWGSSRGQEAREQARRRRRPKFRWKTGKQSRSPAAVPLKSLSSPPAAGSPRAASGGHGVAAGGESPVSAWPPDPRQAWPTVPGSPCSNSGSGNHFPGVSRGRCLLSPTRWVLGKCDVSQWQLRPGCLSGKRSPWGGRTQVRIRGAEARSPRRQALGEVVPFRYFLIVAKRT